MIDFGSDAGTGLGLRSSSSSMPSLRALSSRHIHSSCLNSRSSGSSAGGRSLGIMVLPPVLAVPAHVGKVAVDGVAALELVEIDDAAAGHLEELRPEPGLCAGHDATRLLGLGLRGVLGLALRNPLSASVASKPLLSSIGCGNAALTAATVALATGSGTPRRSAPTRKNRVYRSFMTPPEWH